MRKPGAFAILGTMILLPLLAWGGVKLVDHGEKIAINTTKIEALEKIDTKIDILINRGK